MYDIITIGSALIDTFIHSSEFALQRTKAGVYLCQSYGDKIDVDSMVVHTGGGGGNTAVGFARMGYRTGVVTELGKDVLATVVMEDFHSEKVATNLVISERKEQTGGSVILIGEDGGRTVLVHRGASAQLDVQDLPDTQLQHASWIHLASISGRLGALRHLAKILHEGKRKLSWNPGKAELQLLAEGVISARELPCQVLIVNQGEWAMLDPVHSTLQQTVPMIVVTNGKKGGRYFENESGWHDYDSLEEKSVDDTGAGDAFAVGLVSALLADESLSEAVRWGVYNAASVVKKVGAKPGLLTQTQLRKQLDS